MTVTLAWRRALVTGAGRGIGRALALALAEQSVSVALVARSRGELDEVAAAVRERGGTAVVLPADVGDAEQLAEVAERVGAELGGVDILVNNAAAVRPLGPTVTIDRAAWESTLAVNLLGTVRLTAAVLPGMQDQRWGRVVNVSTGMVAMPSATARMNAYVTSKAAVEAHTTSLAAELTGSGVTANVFRPGTVDTAMQAWIRDQSPDEIGTALHGLFTTLHDEDRLITPETSARALLDRLPGEDNGEIWSVPAG